MQITFLVLQKDWNHEPPHQVHFTNYIDSISNYDNYLLHFKVSYLHVEITLFDFELNARFSIK